MESLVQFEQLNKMSIISAKLSEGPTTEFIINFDQDIKTTSFFDFFCRQLKINCSVQHCSVDDPVWFKLQQLDRRTRVRFQNIYV